MRLGDFQKEKCHHVNRFVNWWNTRHKDDPAGYPLNMPAEYWIEQFDKWAADNPEDIGQISSERMPYTPDGGEAA